MRWIWGPVIEYSLDLEGIDSAGKGGGDIMELIVRAGANRATTSLLLDAFMNGFLHRLFCQKWTLFGRRLFLLRRALDFALLAMTITIAFDLKVRTPPQSLRVSRLLRVLTRSPAFGFQMEAALAPRHSWLVVFMLFAIASDVAIEVASAGLFMSNEQDTSEEHLSLLTLLKLTAPWARMHGVFLLMSAHACTLIAIATILLVDLPVIPPADDDAGYAPPPSTPAAAGRRLKASGGGATSAATGLVGDAVIVDEGAWFALWIILAFALRMLCRGSNYRVAPTLSLRGQCSSLL